MSSSKRSPKASGRSKSSGKSSTTSPPKRPPTLAAPRKNRGLGSHPLGGSPLGGGRGLGALIPGGSEQSRLIEVALDCVQPDPHQPRKRFKRSALEELATSIKAQGILQPLIV